MAQDKKGFIMYADQQEIFDQLSDVRAGKLIKLILSYVNDEDPKPKDPFLKLAFTPIKTQLKRDLKHWENIRQKRSEAGKLGGRPKKQTEAKKANGSFDKQTKAKKAVIVNVNVNVNDIVNDNEINYKGALINYCNYLINDFNRSLGHMQIEQMIKMLESWYTSKENKELCLSANIANNWKTLNYIEAKELKTINYEIE